MTEETRTTIELQDVVAIEFGCRRCSAKFVLAFNEHLTIPRQCANCQEEWFGLGRPERAEMERFIEQIRYYQRNSFPYDFRLQLAPDLGDQRWTRNKNEKS
jgi:hypothetical protein